jgi:nitroreductase
MNVSDAVDRRTSVRAFLPDPVEGAVVRDLLQRALRAPSGGNLQPWRIHALAGAPLAAFRERMRTRLAETVAAGGLGGEGAEYAVYPEALHEPYRTRRYAVGEAMYARLGIERMDKAGRLAWFARNFDFFGAPVGLFFSLDRRMGPPQWSDLGMLMQTVMLLAVERGLDTCAQEAWSVWPKTVGAFLRLPEQHMLFSGMALGRRDPAHPLSEFRADRAPLEEVAELIGFD